MWVEFGVGRFDGDHGVFLRDLIESVKRMETLFDLVTGFFVAAIIDLHGE